MNSNLSRNKGQKAPAPVFLAATVVIFFLSLSAADSVGFVPCYFDGTPCSSDSVALSNLPELGDTSAGIVEEERVASSLPKHIVISGIGLDLPVQNPSTRDIAALDEILKDGPARYVDSAKLGEKGNVLVFAHSSHLPVVRNQMYKAFNRIPELKAGDAITLIGEAEGSERSYLYNVVSVRQADAEDAIVDLSPTLGSKLTLVTCDTLTGKSARWIVEADFVGVL
jgi:LPXTG-site transpeptidase (sortase) family protein